MFKNNIYAIVYLIFVDYYITIAYLLNGDIIQLKSEYLVHITLNLGRFHPQKQCLKKNKTMRYLMER